MPWDIFFTVVAQTAIILFILFVFFLTFGSFLLHMLAGIKVKAEARAAHSINKELYK